MKTQMNYKLIELEEGQVLLEKNVDSDDDSEDNKPCIYVKVLIHNDGYFMESKMTLYFETDEERDEEFDNIESKMNMDIVYQKLSDPLKELLNIAEDIEED